jgi:oligopeptide/dipeptide ABC transporter ATP-binding protein
MYAGQVVETLPAADLAASARMPYTEALILAAPDPDVEGRLPRPIEGRPPDPRAPLPGCSFQPRCGYAAADCAARAPGLTVVDDTHSLRCWHPLAAGSALEAARP